ncbi:MAG: hypothetical protein M3032_06945 [Verrucomicrobiota bacterium]|nr:hypothetical protein [Verrucomicrobiota bacterium]
MPTRLLVLLVTLFLGRAIAHAQPRISEDRDLKLLDLTGWDCLNEPGGSAKTGDGVERNTGKNRAPIEIAGRDIPAFDHAGFLQHVSGFEALTKGKRRKDLSAPERQQLAELEKQVVSYTGYLVLAYAGPPETTNCANVDFHDWHFEVFEKPQDHAPRVGDPTPIICEITPRTQNAIFNAGVRIQKLAGFFRRPDLETEPTSQPAQRVRITGLLLWDDEHNGSADVGTTVDRIAANKYHQPWRSTAWEIHPVLKIEPLEGAAVAPAPASPPRAIAPAAPPLAAQQITIVDPVKVKIAYGETLLPRGMKLPLLSHDAVNARVTYMGETISVPLSATDFRPQ